MSDDVRNADPFAIDRIPARTIEERIRLAIYWSLQGAAGKDDLPADLSENFIRQLGHVGLKLVWHDGRAIPPVQK